MKLGFIHWHIFENPYAEKPELTKEHYARLAKGLELYNAGLVSKLVVSGTHTFGKPVPKDPAHELSANWLIERGVKPDDILRIPHARLTIEEIAGARKIIEQLKPSEIHVVTSDYHLPRCMAAFQAAYPDKKFVGHSVPIRPEPETKAHVNRDRRLMRRWQRAQHRGK